VVDEPGHSRSAAGPDEFEVVELPSGAWPTGTDYALSIQDPDSLEHPTLRGAELGRDLLGMPLSAAGQSAVVFQLVTHDGPTALRCFTRPPGNGAVRYRMLARHLEDHSCPALVPAVWLDHAVRSGDELWPAVTMPWTPGLTLDVVIEDRLSDPEDLLNLAERWLLTCDELRSAQVAHGDLQHGNILVDDDWIIRLIDLDGVWIPSLNGHPSRETGHPSYQHPWRDSEAWGPNLDSFSAAVIHTTLIALAADPGLWRYHFGENLVLGANDLSRPGGTPAWIDLLRSPDERVRRQASILEQCAASSDPPEGSVRDLIESAPLFAAPVPLVSPASAIPQSERTSRSAFVPTTPVIDSAMDWADVGPSPSDERSVTGGSLQTAPNPGTSGLPGRGRWLGATSPSLEWTGIGALSGLTAGFVAAVAGVTSSGTLTLVAFLASCSLTLTGAAGWLSDRAARPASAFRWFAQSTSLFGLPLLAATTVAVSLIAASGVITTTPHGFTPVVVICAGTIGLTAGVVPIQWGDWRSASVQSVGGALGGALGGFAFATVTAPIAHGDSFVLIDRGPLWIGLGGGFFGLLVGMALGLGRAVLTRRAIIPQFGWRAGRAIPTGGQRVVVGTTAHSVARIEGAGVLPEHLIVERVPGQFRVDQALPVGTIWLEGRPVTEGFSLPYGETTLHIARADGPMVVYRRG